MEGSSIFAMHERTVAAAAAATAPSEAATHHFLLSPQSSPTTRAVSRAEGAEAHSSSAAAAAAAHFGDSRMSGQSHHHRQLSQSQPHSVLPDFDSHLRPQQRDAQSQDTRQREPFPMFLHSHLQSRLHTPTPLQHDYFTSHTHPSVGLESVVQTPNPTHAAGVPMTPQLHRHHGNEQQLEQHEDRDEHQHAQRAHADLFGDDAPGSSHPPRQMREDQAMHAAQSSSPRSSSPDPGQHHPQPMRQRQHQREAQPLSLSQLAVHFNQLEPVSDAEDSDHMGHALLPASTQPLQQHFQLEPAAAVATPVVAATGDRKRKHDGGSAAGDPVLSTDRESQAKMPRTWLAQDHAPACASGATVASAAAVSSSPVALPSIPPHSSASFAPPPPRHYLSVPPPPFTIHSSSEGPALPATIALTAPPESRMMQNHLVQQHLRQQRALQQMQASSHAAPSAPLSSQMLPPPALQSAPPRWHVGAEAAASALADRSAPVGHSSDELLQETVERLQAQNAALRNEVQSTAWQVQERQQRNFIHQQLIQAMQQQQQLLLTRQPSALADTSALAGLAPWPSHLSLATVPLSMLSEFETRLTTQLAAVRAEQARRNGCIGVACLQRRAPLMPNERSTVCLPCGHRVLCESCMADSSSCPTCKLFIERFIVIESEVPVAPLLGASSLPAAAVSAPMQRHRIISKPKPGDVHVVSDDEREQETAAAASRPPRHSITRGVGSSAAVGSRKGINSGLKTAAASSASRSHASASAAAAVPDHDSSSIRVSTGLISKAFSGGASSSTSKSSARRKSRPKLSDSEDYEPPPAGRSKSRGGSASTLRTAAKPRKEFVRSADLFLSAVATSPPSSNDAVPAAAASSSSSAEAVSSSAESSAAAAASSSDSHATPTGVARATAMTRKLALLKPRNLVAEFNSIAAAAAAAVATAATRTVPSTEPTAGLPAAAAQAAAVPSAESVTAPLASASPAAAASSDAIPPLEQCSSSPSINIRPPLSCTPTDAVADRGTTAAPLKVVVTPASPAAATSATQAWTASATAAQPTIQRAPPPTLSAVIIAAQHAAAAAETPFAAFARTRQ